jgi:hypothetical protein
MMTVPFLLTLDVTIFSLFPLRKVTNSVMFQSVKTPTSSIMAPKIRKRDDLRALLSAGDDSNVSFIGIGYKRQFPPLKRMRDANNALGMYF